MELGRLGLITRRWKWVTVLSLLLVLVCCSGIHRASLGGYGEIQYSDAVPVSQHQIDRLTGLTDVVVEYGSECFLRLQRISLLILPYAEFEQYVIDRIEDGEFDPHRRKTKEEEIEGFLGDDWILFAINDRRDSVIRVGGRFPHDSTYAHELFHLMCPFLNEEETREMELGFVKSSQYKNWLRENY